MSHRRPNCSDSGAQTIGPEEFVLSTGQSLEAIKTGLYLPKMYPGERFSSQLHIQAATKEHTSYTQNLPTRKIAIGKDL